MPTSDIAAKTSITGKRGIMTCKNEQQRKEDCCIYLSLSMLDVNHIAVILLNFKAMLPRKGKIKTLTLKQ